MSPLNFSRSSSTVAASIPNVAIPAAFRIGPRNLTSAMKNRVQGLGCRVDGRGEGGVVIYAVSCSATLSRLSRGFSSLAKDGFDWFERGSLHSLPRRDGRQEASPCSSLKPCRSERSTHTECKRIAH